MLGGKTPPRPPLPPQSSGPTVGLPGPAVVLVSVPTLPVFRGVVTGLVKFCGTKIRFRLASAATECEPEDCGMVSTRTLVMLMTPSTAPEPSGEPVGLTALLAPR